MHDRVGRAVLFRWRITGCSAAQFCGGGFAVLVALCLLTSHAMLGQQAETAVAVEAPVATIATTATGGGVMRTPAPKQPVEQELAVMGMIPDGDYRLISTTIRCDAWTLSVEYDRHSLGRLLGAQWDYVAEVLPFVLQSEPAKADFWGNPESPYQQRLYGVAILPIGYRLLWRGNRSLKFYLSNKLGAIVYNQKAFSESASAANLNVQAAFGVQYRLSERVDLRVEPFTFFHVSNAYFAASNPGMDELATRYGISYHLGRKLAQ